MITAGQHGTTCQRVQLWWSFAEKFNGETSSVLLKDGGPELTKSSRNKETKWLKYDDTPLNMTSKLNTAINSCMKCVIICVLPNYLFTYLPNWNRNIIFFVFFLGHLMAHSLIKSFIKGTLQCNVNKSSTELKVTLQSAHTWPIKKWLLH